MDFAREEQMRQRKLDSIDSAIQQIDKEVLAGRISEQEAYPIRLKYEMNKMGVDIPVSLLPTGDEEERYGVQPYWMRGREAPEGSPERQLYEAKMKQTIEGRAGTIPWDLHPDNISTPMARASREGRELYIEDFMNEDEKRKYETSGIVPLRFQGAETTGAPLVETPTEIPIGQIRVTSPTGVEGTIPIEDLEDALAEGYTEAIETPVESPMGEEKGLPFGLTTPPPLTLYRLIRQYYKLPKEVRKARREEKVRKGIERSPLYRVGK